MIDILQYEFVRNAFLAGILISIACGIVGTLVVVNRLSFLAGGIAHAAYGGLGLAAFLGLPPVTGIVPFTISTSLLMGYVARKNKERSDTIIGVMWAVGMALGIILIDLKSGYHVDLMSYLFGSIMTISATNLLLMVILDITIILLITIFYKEVLGVSYDEEFATISGVPATLLYYLIITMIAFTVIMLIQAVGLILVIALFTIPASIAGLFTKDLKRMMFTSSILGIIFTISGLIISYFLDLTAGATIILTACSGYAAALLIKRKLKPVYKFFPTQKTENTQCILENSVKQDSKLQK